MKFLLSFTAILCAAFFPACTASTENSASENILRFATSYKIQSLAPSESASYFLIEYNIAETPLFLDDDADLKGNLLETYERIDDKNWRLVVGDNIRFQNGNPVTAEKFAAAMNYQIKNSPAAQSLLPNFSVKVTGEREITLTTAEPNPNVPSALADETGFPIFDVECIEQANGESAKIIAGGCYTGAFRVKSLDEREMNLERFENYRRGIPALEKVVVKFVPEAQVRILAVQSGEADIALYPPSEAKRILENQPNAFFKTSAAANGGPRLFLNVRRAPFDDVRVRRAASFGIKYESLAREIFDGIFETADGFYPATFPFAVKNQKTDLAEAAKLLDEAGWERGADNLRRKNGDVLAIDLMTYPQQPDWVKLATAIQANLREIGFEVKIRQVDDINSALKTENWNLGINSPGMTTNGGAPDSFLRDFLTTGGAKNFGGVSDAELDNLVETLSQTFEKEKRNELLRRIQEIVIAEKVYEIRPVFSRSRIVAGRRFSSYEPSPRLHHVTFETKPD